MHYNVQKRHRFHDVIRRAKAVPCLDCSEAFPYFCMDFDHREPSEKMSDINYMVVYCSKFSFEQLHEEIAKCDVVCVNCHRIRTHKVGGPRFYDRTRYASISRNVAFLNETKSRPCSDCDKHFPVACMDLDHVRGTKVLPVGRMTTCAESRFRAEVAKCDVVCACCHRKRTHERTGRPIFGIPTVTVG